MIIELEALREQDIPYQCPYCYETMTNKDTIGETEYTVNRIGHNIGGIAVIFECPKCFEKSFVHGENLNEEES
jgi:predicted RNA-binding Zn-ribbon protein involved in translation (DUF1610 family)